MLIMLLYYFIVIIKCYLINNVFIHFNLLGAEPECGPTFGPHGDILTDPGPVSDGLYLET